MYLKGPRWSMIKNNYIDVFKREFPVFDVAQGLIGNPHIFSKGNPPSWSIILQRKLLYLYPIQNNLGYPTFLSNLI